MPSVKARGLQCERALQMNNSPMLAPLTCRIGKSAARLLSLQADESGRSQQNKANGGGQGGATPSSGASSPSVSVAVVEAGRLLANQSGTHHIAHGDAFGSVLAKEAAALRKTCKGGGV